MQKRIFIPDIMITWKSQFPKSYSEGNEAQEQTQKCLISPWKKSLGIVKMHANQKFKCESQLRIEQAFCESWAIEPLPTSFWVVAEVKERDITRSSIPFNFLALWHFLSPTRDSFLFSIKFQGMIKNVAQPVIFVSIGTYILYPCLCC